MSERSGDLFDLRVGHFYGLFGRGLVFAAYEDRFIRIDTVLDGLLASTTLGRFSGTVLSGRPSVREENVRAFDGSFDLGRSTEAAFPARTVPSVATGRGAERAGPAAQNRLACSVPAVRAMCTSTDIPSDPRARRFRSASCPRDPMRRSTSRFPRPA